MQSKNKWLFKNLPTLVKVLIYLGGNYLLIFLTQFITGFLPFKGTLSFNIFLCVLLLIFTRWILKMEGMQWKSIGCIAGKGKDRLTLFYGCLVGILMLLATALCIKLFTGFQWQRNHAFSWFTILSSLITVFCSVFVQELAFRGYPFRLMIEKWGAWPAQLLTAFLFGLMHVTADMNLSQILLTLLTTGAGSILFGLAVMKTNRLHLAVGLHFGWNYTQLLLPRSASQNGEGIWMVTGQNAHSPFNTLIYVAPYLLVVLAACLFIIYYKNNRSKNISLYNTN